MMPLLKQPNILGVVEHSQHFALRCGRENLQKVRKILTPESLFVPEGEMPPDSEAFHLKHLTDHATPEALTAALAQLGWNAKAVRPVNQSTWLITAKDTPPARHLCINGSFVVVVSLKKPCDTVIPKLGPPSSALLCSHRAKLDRPPPQPRPGSRTSRLSSLTNSKPWWMRSSSCRRRKSRPLPSRSKKPKPTSRISVMPLPPSVTDRLTPIPRSPRLSKQSRPAARHKPAVPKHAGKPGCPPGQTRIRPACQSPQSVVTRDPSHHHHSQLPMPFDLGNNLLFVVLSARLPLHIL